MTRAWRPRTTLEILRQTDLVPIGDVMVTLAELPPADAASYHGQMLDRSAELYDQAMTDAFAYAMATGRAGTWSTLYEHPEEWIQRQPLVRALFAQAYLGGWVGLQVDPAELDHVAGELRRTEGTPMVIDGEIVQNRGIES